MIRLSYPLRAARTMFVLFALTLLSATAGKAQETIQPLPPDGTYYGLKMADWVVALFQWKFSLPSSLDPDAVVDETGERAGIGQRGPVWFLPIFQVGTGTRTFIVPEGHAILTSVGWTMFHAPPGKYTDDQLRARAVNTAFLDQVAARNTTRLNGVRITDLKQYRVVTPVFSITLPPDNVLGVPVAPGEDPRVAAVATGHFLLFPLLPAGRHVYTTRSDTGHVDWTIHLIIQKPNVPLP
jgi:hypothetical protein